MAQSPIRRPVSQVEDFKARFGVVQGQRATEQRQADSQASASSGFSSRQMVAAIALAMVAGMSGAGVFWFAQDFGASGRKAPETLESTAAAPQAQAAPEVAAAPAVVPAATVPNSSVQKSSNEESPVLAAGTPAESTVAMTPPPAAEPTAEATPEAAPAADTHETASAVEIVSDPVPAAPVESESSASAPAVTVQETPIAGSQSAANPPATEQIAPALPEAPPAEPVIDVAAPQPTPEQVALATPPVTEAEPVVEAAPVAEAAPAPVPEPVVEPEVAAQPQPEQQQAAATVVTEAPARQPEIAPGQVWTDCDGCPEIVAIVVPKPAAVAGQSMQFAAASEASGLAPFAIGRFEITAEDWARCVAAGACKDIPSDGNAGAGKLPVVNVSHQMIAGQYLPWLSTVTGKAYRLPTSEEWDLADEGGEAGLSRGAASWSAQLLCASANYAAGPMPGGATCDDPFPQSAPVGSYQANAIGLHDMRGNVWEWVSDCWTPGFNYKAKPSERDCRKHVVRGGSWSSQPSLSVTAPRGFEDQTRTARSIGFRIARSLP